MSGVDRQFVTFYLRGQLFGVAADDVKEVHPTARWAPIPHAPKMVVGYANIRLQIFLVLDIGAMLGLPPETVKGSRLILFRPQVGDSFGIQVDDIAEIVAIPDDRMESWGASPKLEHAAGMDVSAAETPGTNKHQPGLVTHVAKLDTELLMIIEPRSLLPALGQEIATSGRHHSVKGPP